MVNAQEYLDRIYPKEKRGSVTNLNVSRKELRGALIIEDFVNLRELNCSFNGWGSNEGITNLEIKNCPKLEIIRCQYNQIPRLNLQKLSSLKTLICNDNILSGLDLGQNENLEALNIMNNNFSESDLFSLNLKAKLKKLELGTGNREMIEKGLYNRFSGSLEHLADLKELTFLDIRNTDISSGLEYLPDSVQTFNCSHNLVSNSRIRIIYNSLVKGGDDIDGKGFVKEFTEKLADYKKKKKEESAFQKAEIESLKSKLADLSREKDEEIKRMQAELEKKEERIKKLDQHVKILEGMLTSDSTEIINPTNISQREQFLRSKIANLSIENAEANKIIAEAHEKLVAQILVRPPQGGGNG